MIAKSPVFAQAGFETMAPNSLAFNSLLGMMEERPKSVPIMQKKWHHKARQFWAISTMIATTRYI